MANLFQKPKLESKEQLAQLQKDIFVATARLEGIDKQYIDKHILLETEFQREKAQKSQTLGEIENTVAILRSERTELEKPIEYKHKELTERESGVLKRESELVEREQNLFERERYAENKLKDVQALADELGETRVRQLTKEATIRGRESLLQERENAHLVKIEKFSHEVNEAAAKIQERENAVLLKELNVQGQEENLVKREKELLNGHILLNDQRGTLARAWKELKDKQHGSPKRLAR